MSGTWSQHNFTQKMNLENTVSLTMGELHLSLISFVCSPPEQVISQTVLRRANSCSTEQCCDINSNLQETKHYSLTPNLTFIYPWNDCDSLLMNIFQSLHAENLTKRLGKRDLNPKPCYHRWCCCWGQPLGSVPAWGPETRLPSIFFSRSNSSRM